MLEERNSTRWWSRRRRSCTPRWWRRRSRGACTSSARSPSCSTSRDGERLVALAEARQRVTQVGYHYRFVGAFKEAARIVDSRRARRDPPRSRRGLRAGRAAPEGRHLALGEERGRRRALRLRLPRHRPRELHRRRRRVGRRRRAQQRVLARRRRRGLLHALRYAGGASGQLCVNWSDESFRKMSTKISVWGTNGRLTADRQECQLYLREPHAALPGVARAGRCATPPSSPRRSGSTCAARSTRRRSTTSSQSIEHGRTRRRRTRFRSALDADRVVGDDRSAQRRRPPVPAAPRHAHGRWSRMFG